MINICFDGRVLKNGLFSNNGRTGIYFVARNILLELNKREKQYKISLFLDKQDIYMLDKLSESLNINISKKDVLTVDSDFSNIDVFFSPIFKIPDEIRQYPNVSCYTVLYDIIPLLFPECFGDACSQPWLKEFISSVNKEDYYFSISDYTKYDFLKFFKQMKSDHIDTIPLSTNFPYKPVHDEKLLKSIRKKYNIPSDKKYLFSLCSLEPRKNLIRAVKTFIEFIKKNKINDLIYVLGGGAWNGFIEKLENEVPDYKKYSDKIIRAGYVDDADLAILYSNAEWFIYTSQYEGFGMPPLEAMSCGCPVITSNNSSLPEVVGNAGIMIDWDSDEQHIAAYEKYYKDEKYRKSMAKKGLEHSKQFSWEKAVDIILNKITSVEKLKNNKPMVTIVTAVYNLIKNGRKDTFAQTVESVQNQTYKNIEHIVIDGASKDGTIDLLKKYQKKGLIKYYSEPDKGLYDAINKGILKAKGKYVVVLNSDDFYCDNRAVEMLVKKAEENNADAVCAGAKSVDPKTLEVKGLWSCHQTDEIIFGYHACHQTFLIKTDVMKELGLYDLDYKISADTAFMFKMLNADKNIITIEPIIITYRLGGVSANASGVKSDVTNALFTNYGQYHRLTKIDAGNLVHNSFVSLPLDDALVLGAKLEKPEWNKMFFEKWLANNMVNNVNMVPGNGNSVQETPNKLKETKYNLFDCIPMLKIKERYNVKRYLLFEVFPIFKTKYDGTNTQSYLFAFIPLLYKNKNYKAEYKNIQPGIYAFANKLPFDTDGLCDAETWGAWSEGNETSLFLKTNANYIAEFDVEPFLTNGKTKQVVSLCINGREKNKYVFESGKEFPKIMIHLPKSRKLHVSFKYEDVKSPKDVGLSEDVRKIALGFKTVKIIKL